MTCRHFIPAQLATGSTSRFHDAYLRELTEASKRYGRECDVDLMFIAFLRATASFGYVTVGPFSIDVAEVEVTYETLLEGRTHPLDSNDSVRMSELVAAEATRAGRKRPEDLDYLFAFMALTDGLAARVFGELGVTAKQVVAHFRVAAARGTQRMPALLSPDDVATYLGVRVATVRNWIRSGKLPARRVAGLRVLRVRAADVDVLLRPLNEDYATTGDVESSEFAPRRLDGLE